MRKKQQQNRWDITKQNSDDVVSWHPREANISKMRSSGMNISENNEEQAANVLMWKTKMNFETALEG